MNKVRMRSRSTILAIMLICLSVIIVSVSTLAVLRGKYKATDNASFGKIEISTEQNFAKVNSSLLDAVAGDKLTDAITISKSESSDPMYIRVKVGFDTDSTNADVVDYVNRLNRYDFGMAQNTTGYKWSDRYGRYYFLLDDADNIFSINTSEPITLTDSFTIPFAMAEMEENEQYFEHATFSVEIQAVQSAVVEDMAGASDSQKAQLRAVDKVFAEVFGERAEILSTLSTDYLDKLGITDKSTVSSITFFDNGFTLEGVSTVDLSEDNTNTIIGWSKLDSTTNLYDLYISSDQRIALPEYCGWLFAMYKNAEGYTITNLKEINNMSALDTSKVTNMESMIENCEKLEVLDVSSFDTSKVTNMREMFAGCSSLTSLDVSNFDTSNVTEMSGMFNGCRSLTSLDLSSFDISQVTNMKSLFCFCNSLNSLDVGKFNTSQVTDMRYMFNGCSSLTSLDVSSFDTSKVTNMREMFAGCSSLTSLDVSNFDTSNVTEMSGMFNGCSSLTSLDLSNFDTSKVTSMGNMFIGCGGLTSLDVSKFNTSQVTVMSCMFNGCSLLTNLDVSNFDTSKVTNMYCMFDGCTNLKTLNVSKFNTSQVTDMGSMFYWCSSLTSLDLSSFDTGKVTSMYGMFCFCNSLNSLDVGKFNTSQVTDMRYMFNGCSSLTSLDLSKFDTRQVTNMENMFYGCSSLTSLDVSSFNTSQVTSMVVMFAGCSSLTSLDVSKFNTSQVTDMGSMFVGCSSLTSLDVSSFDTSQVISMGAMFVNCTKLESVLLGDKWSISNVSRYQGLFNRTDKAKVFCVNAEQKTWLSTTKSLIDSSRVFVLISDESVKTALNSASWTDLTDYTTIQTAEYNSTTYYKIKGGADFYAL